MAGRMGTSLHIHTYSCSFTEGLGFFFFNYIYILVLVLIWVGSEGGKTGNAEMGNGRWGEN